MTYGWDFSVVFGIFMLRYAMDRGSGGGYDN